MDSLPHGDLAVVIGASGAIGGALMQALQRTGCFANVVGFGRATTPALDLLDEASIAGCAAWLREMGAPRLVIVATGILHLQDIAPEKSMRQLDPVAMARLFSVNTIGPAIVMKHFLPLLPRDGKAVLAVLSARVGSIGDNHLGGWFSYRASKAAVNQLVRTAAVELGRRQRHAICVALHPGTVDSALSAPFSKTGLEVQSPSIAAARILAVIDQLAVADSGEFLDQHGKRVPW